jgi:hypothetical protein
MPVARTARSDARHADRRASHYCVRPRRLASSNIGPANGATPAERNSKRGSTAFVLTRAPTDRRRGASNSYGGCDETFRPYRHLAVRVLTRAFLDLTNPVESATERESARAFLAGSAMLFHWCRVAALDPWCIVNQAAKLTIPLRRELVLSGQL